jgi:hypothetical protein
MKVQNIAAMLKEEGYKHSDEVSCLSGVPAGEQGRRTNWDIVETLANTDKDVLLKRCKTILLYYGKEKEEAHTSTKTSTKES